MSSTRILSQIDEYRKISAVAGLPEPKPDVVVSMWESYVRRLTHVLVLLSSGEAAPSGFMAEGLDNYLSAGWEAWISLYAFYCARFSILETRNFISPSSLIALLRAVIEPQHETLIKTQGQKLKQQ